MMDPRQAQRLRARIGRMALENGRTLMFLYGLVMLNLGLRGVWLWSPYLDLGWVVPGVIVTCIAIFGARGGRPPVRRGEVKH